MAMYINAMGHYVPSGRVPNEYFEKVNGLTSDWIMQRTGIQTRSKANADENCDTMALAAVEDALKTLPYDIKEVDLIVGAYYSVYDSVATAAHVVQQKYQVKHAKVVYASAACSSFINGLEIAEGYFAMGKARKALIICSEHNTYYSNEKDPKSGHLWGDAAVAYFVSSERQTDDDIEILDIFTEGLGDVGKGPGGVKLRPGEDGISMPDGRDVFINACRYMIYSSVLSTAPLSDFEITSIAFRWNISESSHAPFVMYPSIACVRASIPVAAVSPFGIDDIMSGSTIATTGISCTSTQTIFLLFSVSVIT